MRGGAPRPAACRLEKADIGPLYRDYAPAKTAARRKERTAVNKNGFAPTPPMGWNSYDCYDTTVTEAQVRANAAYMAEHLKEYGWEYVVVDIQWYAHRPDAQRDRYQYLPFGELAMDGFSRLLPDPERFPSSAGGKGFGPLAEYVHGLGLKFGIHIMRGIPRQAAHGRLGIKGRAETADMVADPSSVCRWNPDMYGVRACEAGQAYYDSLLELYAGWGVDFIKCDDICNTDNASPFYEGKYGARHEVEMLAKAIQRCGRPVVLSLSPGPALIGEAWHYEAYANMWRITDDFWDDWALVKGMFPRCELWEKHVAPGCWPDCDMLPVGRIGKGFRAERETRLTRDEQRSMMGLWCVFGSPLMVGAELTRLDSWTLGLLTNRRVLRLLDPARKRRQVWRDSETAVWASEDPAEGTLCAALFNLAGGARELSVGLEELGLPGQSAGAEELWTGARVRAEAGRLRAAVPGHGCGLFEFRRPELP